MTALRWGMLSIGSIASMVVRATRGSELTDFVAVASRGADRARRFAAEQGVEHHCGSYEELLASNEVDAVYVALPPSLHAEWTVRALEIVGSDGTLVVPDPWVCRAGRVEIRRGADVEVLEVRVPAGYAIGQEEDVHRIELDRVSAAITSVTPLPFGRDDAVAQARALEAVRTSYERAAPVSLGALPTAASPA